MAVIDRVSASGTAVIANGATTSGEISAENMAGGSFQIPSAFSGASVSFTGTNESGGTFVAIHDSTNTVVSQTVTASKAYAFPATVMQFRFFKIVSASAEGAARSIPYTLKG